MGRNKDPQISKPKNRHPRRHRPVGQEALRIREARVAAVLLHYAEITDEKTQEARDRFGFLIKEAFKDPKAYGEALAAEHERRVNTADFLMGLANMQDLPTPDEAEKPFVYPMPIAPDPEAAPGVSYRWFSSW